MIEALEEVAPQLRQVLGRHSIPVEDGKDLIQDALLVLLERLRSPERPVERPAGFLLGILRRLCVAYWRGRRARPEEALDGLEVATLPNQLRAEDRRLLVQLLGSVNARHRRMVLLRVVGGYDAREVARSFGLAPESVRKSVLRACRKMLVRASEDAASVAGS